jgi:hypothetical protein
MAITLKQALSESRPPPQKPSRGWLFFSWAQGFALSRCQERLQGVEESAHEKPLSTGTEHGAASC